MVEIKEIPLVSLERRAIRKRGDVDELVESVFKDKGFDLDEWLSKGYAKKTNPNVYIYEIEFDFYKEYKPKGRWWFEEDTFCLRGILALVKIDQLLRHENRVKEEEAKIKKSFEKHKIQVSPIMGMFDDKSKIIENFCARFKSDCEEILEISFSESVPPDAIHRLYAVKGEKATEVIEYLKTVFSGVDDLPIVIDGHHRLGALQMMGAKYAPVFLVDSNDPALKLLSWQRRVKKIKGPHIKKLFDVITHNNRMKTEFGTKLFKAPNITALRNAAHRVPYAEIPSLVRRDIAIGDEPMPEWTIQRLTKRPLVGDMWEGLDMGKVRLDENGDLILNGERHYLFGLYFKAEESDLPEKFYLLAEKSSISRFLVMVDNILLGVVGKGNPEIIDRNESSVKRAYESVKKGEYDLAVFVPALRTRDVINLVKENKPLLPAKLTCFIPKPVPGLINCDMRDLSE